MSNPETPLPLSTKEVSGQKVVVGSVVGCLVFIVVMALGTWFVGQATTPYFKKKAERQEAEAKAIEKIKRDQASKASSGASAPSN